MLGMKLLVVEDEPELLNVMRDSLEKEGFLVESAIDYNVALDKIGAYDYDCILLDVMLPGGSGLDVLAALKDQGKSDSVIIISAKDSLDDRLTGLNLGADDYLCKPFHLAEMNARVRSVLRRRSFDGQNEFKVANLSLNLQDRTVSVDETALELNRKEFDVLNYFLVNKERLVSKSSLAEHVWGDYIDQVDDFEFIYSQVKNLRKKLRDAGAGVEIKAVYGIGYKLTVI